MADFMSSLPSFVETPDLVLLSDSRDFTEEVKDLGNDRDFSSVATVPASAVWLRLNRYACRKLGIDEEGYGRIRKYRAELARYFILRILPETKKERPVSVDVADYLFRFFVTELHDSEPTLAAIETLVEPSSPPRREAVTLRRALSRQPARRNYERYIHYMAKRKVLLVTPVSGFHTPWFYLANPLDFRKGAEAKDS
jgi:hypothetical protein